MYENKNEITECTSHELCTELFSRQINKISQFPTLEYRLEVHCSDHIN